MKRRPIPMILLLLLTALSTSTAWAARIDFDPVDQSANVGDTVHVDILVSELGGEIVSAYDLDVLYDRTFVRATRVAFEDSLGNATFFEAFNDSLVGAPGTVDLAQISLLSDADLFTRQGGDGAVLATIFFEAVRPGTTRLDFLIDSVNDVKGRNGLILGVETSSGSIRVLGEPAEAVPEPSAALLFLVCGSFAAAGIRRREETTGR